MKRIMGYMLAVTLMLAGLGVQAQEVQTWAGFVVTGNVAIAKSTVVTRNEPYMVKRLLIKITQPASATANVYKYSIRAK